MKFDIESINAAVNEHDFKVRVVTAANAAMKLKCPEWDLDEVKARLDTTFDARGGHRIAVVMTFKSNGLF